MDKQRPPSPRDMSHKGGQQSGQQAKSGQVMPPGSGQMAQPPKGTPTHGNK
ncbi:hypothetical protein [Edaphobacter dinghuensis]|uniref:Uncharacterized protein n=1 Tax=Edaphobacter dinghuensis TaxID=1560005 RepID=A0A917H3R4_9BACT|nr:hypothetical protein [Edaphobacter dinghuensis]GGG66509.1 hypothetical protein GCM10011585_05440 [Edaphobacter dinghuensis]